MKKLLPVMAAFFLALTLGGCTSERAYVYSPSIENCGFERGDLSGWSCTGNAFTVSTDDNGWYRAEGRYFVKGNAEEKGEISSTEFTLGNTGYLSFLIGAGDGDCYVAFYEGETLLKTVKNPYIESSKDDRLRRVLVDMREHSGKKIFIKIVDNSSDLVYSYINIDEFDVNVTQTDLAIYKGMVSEVL